MIKRWLMILVLGIMVSSGRAQAQESNATPLDAVLSYTGIDAWHAVGLDGSGARIGIIDVGFAGADALADDLILPEDVDPAFYYSASTAHGTWVYEVLHAAAPGATYFLYQLNPSGKNLPDAVEWLLAMDVDAVNFSASALDVPLNGTNYQSQQLGRLVDADIVVVTSAGNYGISFVTETFTDTDGDGWHEFQWGYEAMWAAPYNTEPYGETHLRWQDVYTSAGIDLDLYVFAEDGSSVLKASTRVQQGGSADWPYEDTFYPTVAGTPIYIGIRAKQPGTIPEGTVFYIYADDSTLGASSSDSSLTAPADSPKILAVGAIEANETLWARSGRGPTWDGRIKPDLVAPSRLQLGSTSVPFTGTSASTPIVTAAAAILRAAFPDLSEAEVRQWLVDRAGDLGETGPDNLFGYGRLRMPPPG